MGRLFEKGAFTVVGRKRAVKGDNSLVRRFVHAIKHINTELPAHKEPFVVQGNVDRETPMLVNTSRTIWQHSVRIVVTDAAIYGYAL